MIMKRIVVTKSNGYVLILNFYISISQCIMGRKFRGASYTSVGTFKNKRKNASGLSVGLIVYEKKYFEEYNIRVT